MQRYSCCFVRYSEATFSNILKWPGMKYWPPIFSSIVKHHQNLIYEDATSELAKDKGTNIALITTTKTIV